MTTYVAVGVQSAVTIVMTPVLVRGLGKSGYGIWSLALSLVLYLELLEFGFAKSTTRAVARYEALGDREAVRRTVTTSVAVLLLPAALALAGGLILALIFPRLFDLDPSQVFAARIVCVAFAVDLALSIPSDTFGATLAGLQRFDLVNATLIATAVAQGAGWFLVLRLGGGLVALAIVTVACALAGQAARAVVAGRLVGSVAPTLRRFDRRMVKPLAGASVWFFVADLAEVVVSRIDTVVVGVVVGVPQAAVYAVALKLSLLADRAFRPATTSFFPQSAALSAGADVSALRPVVRTGTRISLGVAWPLCLSLMLLAGPALEGWVGPEFAEGRLVVVLLAATVAVKALTRTGVLALQGIGSVRSTALVNTGEAVLNLALSVVLGRTMGLPGVALATLLAAVASELGIILPYLCRKLDLPLGGFLLTVLRAHILPVSLALVVGLALRQQVEGVAAVVGAALLMCGAYLTMFAFTGLTPEERRSLIRMLRTKNVRAPQ